MEIDYKAIGNRVKEARKKAGMSQVILSEKSGYSKAHLSNIEHASTKVSLQALMDIANALEVTLDTLMCDDLFQSKQEFNAELQEVLQECNPYEMRVIVEVAKAQKQAMTANRKILHNI